MRHKDVNYSLMHLMFIGCIYPDIRGAMYTQHSHMHAHAHAHTQTDIMYTCGVVNGRRREPRIAAHHLA